MASPSAVSPGASPGASPRTYREFIIRDWQPGDRAAAAQVIGDALQEFGLAWEPEGADADVLQVEYYYQNGAFWVVERCGEIVATAAFYPIERGHNAVEIRKMYLRPGVRRQGLGRYLLQQLEQEIAARQFKQIWLETATALAGAVAFYESMGYRPPQASDLVGGRDGCRPGGAGPRAEEPVVDVLIEDSLIETERCDRIYIKQIA